MAKQVLTSLNMNKNEIQNPVIHVLATAPQSPVEGQIYYNSTDKYLYQYNGTAWMQVGEDTNTTYTLDMSTVSAVDNSVGVTLFGSDNSQSTVRIGVDGGSSISKTTSTVGNKPMVVISSPTVDTSISSSSTNSNIPSSKAVYDYVGSAISASDAMIFKGTLGTGGTVTSLPTTYNTGWTYRVITAGTYAGKVCEIGDLIIALVDRTGSGNLDDDWTVAQTNVEGPICYGNGRIFYGTCSTAADTAIKQVVCEHYDSLQNGDVVIVTFANQNTNTSPSLSVNNTTAKVINRRSNGADYNLFSYPGDISGTCMFLYNTKWYLISVDDNTTYPNASFSQKGIVQIGSGLSVTNGGLLSTQVQYGTLTIASSNSSTSATSPAVVQQLVGYSAVDANGEELIVDATFNANAETVTFSINAAYSKDIYIAYQYLPS